MLLSCSVRKFVALAGALLVLMGLVACISPQLFTNDCNCHCKFGRETAAISTLRTIHNLQAQFQESHNRLASLKELAKVDLISARIASGEPSAGYVYSDFEISANTYCVSATRVNLSCWLGLSTSISAYRDFVICEDGIIRGNETKTIRRLQRGEGVPISESSDGSAQPAPATGPKQKHPVSQTKKSRQARHVGGLPAFFSAMACFGAPFSNQS